MDPQLAETQDEPVDSLRRRLADFERRFRLLDEQMRVLERERQKLSAVVHQTDAGFLIFDSSLQVVWANSVTARTFGEGPNPGALLGAPCHRVLCGQAATCAQCPAAQPFQFGAVAHHEVRQEVRGRPHHIYATAMPIKSLTGEIDQVMVMLQDISNLEVLRRSEEALRESESRFRSIFERSAVGKAIVAPDGSFLQVNAAFCDFLGYPEADLLKMTVADVTSPEDLEKTLEILSESRMSPGKKVDIEKRYLRKDGSVAWGHVTSSWLFDGEGKPLYRVSLVQDINERKRAEDALKQSEARKGAILQTALDAIITIDHEGRVTEFNPAAETMFGYSRSEVLGRTMVELIVPPSLRGRHREGFERYLRTGESRLLGKRIEVNACRKDGSEFPVEVAITRIALDGPPVFTGYIRDLTEQKRTEEALRQREEQLRHSQKMEAIGTLAGGVAHDFNNILTGILGYAEILKMNSRPGEKVHQAAEVIEKGAARAASLTQQLLGFARKGKHQDVRLDLRDTIGGAIELLSRTIDKRVEIRQEFGAGAARIQGDPGQIEQVIVNLAVNAADAMPDGGSLTFRTEVARVDETRARQQPGATPGTYLLLSVADTGCGISEESRKRIFEPFFTTKATGMGTGMGLAMVYGIIQNHGGWIEVDSEVGRGTRFRIYLPTVEEEAETEAGHLDAATVAKPQTAKRILIVDDEEPVRLVAAEFLKILGYEVLTTKNGREAVDTFRSRPDDIDLIIIDMVMPHLGGRDCFLALKEIRPDVRAILSTGYDFNPDTQKILDEGMVGFIRKPYQLRQFSEVVEAALRS